MARIRVYDTYIVTVACYDCGLIEEEEKSYKPRHKAQCTSCDSLNTYTKMKKKPDYIECTSCNGTGKQMDFTQDFLDLDLNKETDCSKCRGKGKIEKKKK